MNREDDSVDDVKVRPQPIHAPDRSGFSVAWQHLSTTLDIGDQLGLALRAPSFGDSPSRDFISTSPLHYSTCDYNQRFLDTYTDATANAAKQYAIALSYGASFTIQVGLVPYPIAGFGPYFQSSINAGLTSTGERFLQWQWSLGGGIGSYLALGASEPITLHGTPLQEGKSHSDRIEVNAGLGLLSGSVSANKEGEVTFNLSSTLRQGLSKGVGEGLAVAYAHSETQTWINPDIQLRESWDNFAASAGREIHDIEVQLYQWSRLMDP